MKKRVFGILIVAIYTLIVSLTGCDSGVTADDETDSSQSKPVAVITVSSTTVQVGNAVTLDASYSSVASGSITAYAWDIDNDGTAEYTTAHASHTYASAGQYTVRLTVTSDSGESDSITKIITVSSTSVPVADISYTITSRTIALDGSGSTGSSLSYAWDIDNNGSVDYTTVTATHTYATDGTYTVKLEVTDANNLTASTTVQITISGSGGGEPLAAVISTGSLPVNEGTSLSLDGSASTGTITSYAWDIQADGTTEYTTQNISHTFARQGSYRVSLTVSDGSSTDTDTVLITVADSNGNVLNTVVEVISDDQMNQVLNDYDVVLLDLYMNGCSSCAALASVLDELAVEYAGKVAFVKINYSTHYSLFFHYFTNVSGSNGVPEVHIYKDGTEVDAFAGTRSKTTIEGKLDPLLP